MEEGERKLVRYALRFDGRQHNLKLRGARRNSRVFSRCRRAREVAFVFPAVSRRSGRHRGGGVRCVVRAVRLHGELCVRVCVCVCAGVCVGACVCACVCAGVCVCTCVCVCVQGCVCVNGCACVWSPDCGCVRCSFHLHGESGSGFCVCVCVCLCVRACAVIDRIRSVGSSLSRTLDSLG